MDIKGTCHAYLKIGAKVEKLLIDGVKIDFAFYDNKKKLETNLQIDFAISNDKKVIATDLEKEKKKLSTDLKIKSTSMPTTFDSDDIEVDAVTDRKTDRSAAIQVFQ